MKESFKDVYTYASQALDMIEREKDTNPNYEEIKKLQQIISKKVLDDNLDLERLVEINDYMTILLDSLNHWFFYDNTERYYYDLKSFISWLEKIK